MKKYYYFIIACFCISCSSSVPDKSTVKDDQKTKRASQKMKTDKLSDELDEIIGEKKIIKEKPINKDNLKVISILDSNYAIYKEVMRNNDLYKFGESEGDVYEVVKQEATNLLVESIKQTVVTKRESEVSEINNEVTDIFIKESTSKSAVVLINSKTLDLKPKSGQKFRIFKYISNKDLAKSEEETIKEVQLLLKDAENTFLLKQNLNEAVLNYYKAYLKSIFSSVEIKYNSSIKSAEVSAKNFAEENVQNYLEEVKIDCFPSEKGENIFQLDLIAKYQGSPINNVKVKIKNSETDFKQFIDGKISLFTEMIDLSNKTIGIELEIAPALNIPEGDNLSLIEAGHKIIVQKNIQVNFSRFISLDFSFERINDNVLKFIPKIKNLSISEFYWEFDYGNKLKKSNSTDQITLRTIPNNFNGVIVKFKINNNDELQIVKKVNHDFTMSTISKPDFIKISAPTTSSESTTSTPLPSNISTTPISVLPSMPDPSNSITLKTDQQFENEFKLIKSREQLIRLLEAFKDSGKLVYSADLKKVGRNIDNCYVLGFDEKKQMYLLKPGGENRNTIKGLTININEITTVIFYIKIL